MALSDIDYAARARAAGLNVYMIAEGDRDYHIRTQVVNPANPCCNGYSIAKAFTVTINAVTGEVSKTYTPGSTYEH